MSNSVDKSDNIEQLHGRQRQEADETTVQSAELRQLAASLRARVKPQLEEARLPEGSVDLRIYPHFDEVLETAPGPSMSVRLIGATRTATGSEIGTDVFVISHPEPDRFEVRRMSSARLINEEIGWPRRGMPSDESIDRLLSLATKELVDAQRPTV